MKKAVRHSLFIGLASIASVMVLGVIIIAIARLSVLGESPADFLAADRTVAVIQNMTSKEKEMLQTWFPELGFLNIDSAEAVAIVVLPGGGRGSIVFEHADPGITGENIRGPYKLTLSDTLLLPKPDDQTTFLSEDAAYRAFAKQAERSDTWTYVRKEALPAANDLRSRLLSALLFENAPSIALKTGSGNTLQIDRYVPEKKHRALTQAPLLFPGTFLTFAQNGLSAALLDATSALPAQEDVIMESLQRSLMEKYAGKSVSWEFGSTALLSGETSLIIRPEAETLHYVLMGSTDAKTLLSETLGDLHASFRSILPTSRTVAHTFDNRFNSRILESSEEQILEEEREIGPWTVHVMRHSTENLIFITATSGNRFAVSNDSAFLEEVLQRKGQPIPVEQKELTGVGVVDLAVFSNRIQRAIPKSQTSLLPLTYTGTVIWSLSQKGPVESLVIAPLTR